MLQVAWPSHCALSLQWLSVIVQGVACFCLPHHFAIHGLLEQVYREVLACGEKIRFCLTHLMGINPLLREALHEQERLEILEIEVNLCLCILVVLMVRLGPLGIVERWFESFPVVCRVAIST